MKIFEDLIRQARQVNDHISVQETNVIVDEIFAPMCEEWSPEECAQLLNLYNYEDQKWEIDEEPQVQDFADHPGHVSGLTQFSNAHQEWEEKYPKQVEKVKEAILCLVFDILEK